MAHKRGGVKDTRIQLSSLWRNEMATRSIPGKETTAVALKNSQSTVEQVLSAIATGISTEQARPPVFAASVVSIAADRSMAKVKLCTGSVLDVPMSLLKRVTHRGTVTSGDESLGLASAEIDVSTDVGVFVQQMAREVERLSRALQAAKERLRIAQGAQTNDAPIPAGDASASATSAIPFDIVLPPTAVKITFDGIAGDPYKPYLVFYQAPPFQYIQDWEVIGIVNCYFTSPPVVGGIDAHGRALGLQFFPAARHGTPLGTPYSASIIVNVTLVQLTT